MAAKYRRIDPRMWTDESFQHLSPTDKLVAIYILTAQSNRIGIFTFKLGACSDDTGVPMESCRDAVRRVCEAHSWKYDEQTRVMYLPTWWKYNGNTDEIGVRKPLAPQNLLSLLADVHDLPDSPLVEEFLDNADYLTVTPRNVLNNKEQIRQEMAARGRKGGKAKAKNAGKKEDSANSYRGCQESLAPVLEKPSTQEQEQEQEQESSLSAKTSPEIVYEYFLKSGAKSKPRKLTQDRHNKLNTRLKDHEWPWREAIDKLPIPNTQSFDWQPGLDWLIANGNNAYKVAEGEYDRYEEPGNTEPKSPKVDFDAFKRWAHRHDDNTALMDMIDDEIEELVRKDPEMWKRYLKYRGVPAA